MDALAWPGKQGGQELLGGLNVTVDRNFFGSQIDSFEAWETGGLVTVH